MVLLLKLVLFLVAIIASGWSKTTITKPNMKFKECLKTSTYERYSKKFPCKDLGLCYRYYCGNVHSMCPTCDFENEQSCRLGHQVNAELFNGIRGNRVRRTQPKRFRNKHRMSDFVGDAGSPNPDEYRPQVVRLHVGATWCIGFLATIKHNQRPHPVLLTPAHCVVDFKVTCEYQAGNNGSMKYFNTKEECFQRPKKKILSVNKGFKAYTMTLLKNGK